MPGGGGGGGGWGMNYYYYYYFFFERSVFSDTPPSFWEKKIGAANPWSGTENNLKVNGSSLEMHRNLLKTSILTLHCQLSAISLQSAIPEGGSEEEPLKPTDRQTINHKIKRL